MERVPSDKHGFQYVFPLFPWLIFFFITISQNLLRIDNSLLILLFSFLLSLSLWEFRSVLSSFSLQLGSFKMECDERGRHGKQYVIIPSLQLALHCIFFLPFPLLDFYLLFTISKFIQNWLSLSFFGISAVFQYADFNSDLSKWNTAKVKTMENSTFQFNLFNLLHNLKM